MEGLIELVAACFARHGIECPTGDLQLPGPNLVQASPAEPTLATVLPEHDFRKSLQGDPAP